ncbi:unnamed protein product [Sphenostylis stenocarpa]|uniref:SHSP domain-containing protein n=1 Tax=Sphenostylis stenocarpa TaxID=92480 RepID=A0AA86S3W3_9FABA|nr:unnamed protein product [Sphenostylis stenocarpa]
MSIVPNANPFQDSPFRALSASALAGGASFLGGKFEWEETADAHVLKGNVPGLRREEVKVEVEDGSVLQVSGERVLERQEEGQASHRVQRSRSKFRKCFTLPANAQPDNIMASIEDGILIITLPKLNPPMPIHN